MKDTQVKPPIPKPKPKSGIPKVKMPAKKLKEPKVKVTKPGKIKNTKIKKLKTEKDDTASSPKRKRGRPKTMDKVQTKKKVKEQQKSVKNTENKPTGRKRKMPLAVNIKFEKDLVRPPTKKPKISDSNLNMNGNIKTVLPNLHKTCHSKAESPSPADCITTNHVNGNVQCKKNTIEFKKPPMINSILKSPTFIPPQFKKEMLNGKSCLKVHKTHFSQDTKMTPPKTQSVVPASLAAKSIVKNVKPPKVNNFIVPYREPVKLHPQRMASLDAMAKLHVICIPDRKPIEHHSRTTTSVVTFSSQPSSHQKSVTQVHESIHVDLKKEGKGNIVHKQINYVKEKKEVIVSHSVQQSSVVQQSETSSIKTESGLEKKKKLKSAPKSNNSSVQKKDGKQSGSKSSEKAKTKSEKKTKNSKSNETGKKTAKLPKASKPLKKPPKEKQLVKVNSTKPKKLEQTKSEVKVKETIRMQKTCTYQSVTTVNSHGTSNSSVVPVSHVGMTTNFSKTKKTVVTEQECKNNLNYTSDSIINKTYCVTSESPCSLGHQTDCCKFHAQATPHIIPFAHVQTCALNHSLVRTSDPSSSPSHCDGNFALHKFQHQPSLIYSSPSQDCGCCCSGSLVQNVRDPCLLRKSIIAFPHHFSHHTHIPSGAFSHDSFCTEYHPNPSIDSTRHNAQPFSLSPSTSHSRAGCCSCCELHTGGSQCHHQTASSCLQFISSPKNSPSMAACEQSPLDLSLASASSGSSLESDHHLPTGHYPGPLCCTGDVLVLRTPAQHSFQHTVFARNNPCCRCSRPITCENASLETAQCSNRSLEKNSQAIQLVDNISVSPPAAVAATKGSFVAPAPPAVSVANKDLPRDPLVQAKLEKCASPKLSSKASVPKKRTFSHGWSWKGKPRERLIAFTNDSSTCPRLCYPSVQHQEGDIINERDCVLLKSGPKETDLPYVAKVTALWENPDDGEMMMSLLWYYRPEHTEQGRKAGQMEDEVFASRHKDVNSIACIEDKCYVLSYNEYCRYKANLSMDDDMVSLTSMLVPDLPDDYHRKNRLPVEIVSSDIVFFCRHVYDFRQKRILKNPT